MKTGRLQTLLAVVDPARPGEVLAAAAELAERYDAAITVLSCVEPPRDLKSMAKACGTSPQSLLQALIDAQRRSLEALVDEQLGSRTRAVRVQSGKPFIEIIRCAAEIGADLVIKAADPPLGRGRFLLASTDQHLLRKCPCRVWIQSAGGSAKPRRVIAAVDADDWDAAEPETLRGLNRAVIETARALAAPDGEVIALHAWEAAAEGPLWAFGGGADARQAADRYVKEVRQRRDEALHALVSPFWNDGRNLGAAVSPRLVRGRPEEVIETEADALGADAVVIGTVARTGVGGVIIGNTAENIINALQRSVIAVKPEGFVTPLRLERR